MKVERVIVEVEVEVEVDTDVDVNAEVVGTAVSVVSSSGS